LFALQAELELAALVGRSGIAVGLPDAAVPDDHIARAVLPGRNAALEAAVVQWMVFHMHGQALVAGIQARTLGHCPALQGAVQLPWEVVAQAPGSVLLDNATPGALGTRLAQGLLIRLGGNAEVALAAVLVELAIHGRLPGLLARGAPLRRRGF